METSDARKRHADLREQQAEVQKLFNTREDEWDAGIQKTLDRDMPGWREDFPEPEWRRGGQIETFRDPYEGTRKYDTVDQPEHYTHSKIEVWDAIGEWGLNYYLGNVIKYVARADHKGKPLEDLRKARAYLDKEIATRQLDSRDW